MDTRFKPGQSGNPRGRPKSKPNLSSIVTDELNKTVTVTLDGRPRKMKMLTALVKKQISHATAGNQKALAFLIELYKPDRHPVMSLQDLPDLESLTDDELDKLYKKMLAQGGE